MSKRVSKSYFTLSFPCFTKLQLQVRTKNTSKIHVFPPIAFFLPSGIVFKCQYGRCKVNYYGKTKCYFKVRIAEHISLLALTNEKIQPDKDLATIIFPATLVEDHLIWCMSPYLNKLESHYACRYLILFFGDFSFKGYPVAYICYHSQGICFM